MHSSGRAFVAGILLLLNISCTLDDSSDPCGSGCYSGSPHPYTSVSGGPSSTLTGTVTEDYDDAPVTFTCSSDGTCTWVGSTIEISAALPQGWIGGADGGGSDAGADAEADADADVDAGTDVDADAGVADAGNDGPTGSPRGWGGVGRVAVIDLGRTPLTESSPLVDAYLVTCRDRYEKLATTPEGVFTCLSAGSRPARIVPLVGTYSFSTSGSGDTTSTVMKVDAKTRAGARVSFTLDAEKRPYESYESANCY